MKNNGCTEQSGYVKSFYLFRFGSVCFVSIVHTETTVKTEFHISNRLQRVFQALWAKKARREVLLLDN